MPTVPSVSAVCSLELCPYSNNATVGHQNLPPAGLPKDSPHTVSRAPTQGTPLTAVRPEMIYITALPLIQILMPGLPRMDARLPRSRTAHASWAVRRQEAGRSRRTETGEMDGIDCGGRVGSSVCVSVCGPEEAGFSWQSRALLFDSAVLWSCNVLCEVLCACCM